MEKFVVWLLYLVLVFIAGGCASPYGTSYDMMDPDARQCEYEATAATSGPGDPIAIGVRRGELYALCMRARGK